MYFRTPCVKKISPTATRMKITLPTLELEPKNLFMVTPDAVYTYFSYRPKTPARWPRAPTVR